MNDQINQARLQIAHVCDGPLTPFVLIARAMDLAHNLDYDSRMSTDHISEALFDELTERGWLKEGIEVNDS